MKILKIIMWPFIMLKNILDGNTGQKKLVIKLVHMIKHITVNLHNGRVASQDGNGGHIK